MSAFKSFFDKLEASENTSNESGGRDSGRDIGNVFRIKTAFVDYYFVYSMKVGKWIQGASRSTVDSYWNPAIYEPSEWCSRYNKANIEPCQLKLISFEDIPYDLRRLWYEEY